MNKVNQKNNKHQTKKNQHHHQSEKMILQEKVRTRYAPSPTGYLHIGGARTALFSFLFAKHFHGEFIVRIEDTDLERNIADGEKSQLENLEWLGIIPDESPIKPNPIYGKYRQSEKLIRYQEIINDLIKSKQAYKAYDSPEEILTQKLEQENQGINSFRYNPSWLKITQEEILQRDQKGEYAIRLKLKPSTTYKWNDLVRGEIAVKTSDIGDFVIWKQNGFPTYNFAVVIDDYDMEISHVLRGEEHIANTPKQLAIYDALKWSPPKFGHLTIITNQEGKKLSKRDTSIQQFIEDYKNLQYPPEAIFNFLALLGWTDKDSLEIMSKQELIQRFEPERLSKSPTKFDINKMNWFAKTYIKMMDNSVLINRLNIPSNLNTKWLNVFLDIYKEQVNTFLELQSVLNSYQNLSIHPHKNKNLPVVKTFGIELNKLEFSIENIKQAIKITQDKTKTKGKELFMPIRQAVTYKDHGPDLATDIWLLGEQIVKLRLK